MNRYHESMEHCAPPPELEEQLREAVLSAEPEPQARTAVYRPRGFFRKALLAAVLGALFVGVGVGISIRAGGAPGGDDALAMSISAVSHWDIQWAYLISDLVVLALSATYIDWKRLACSLLTVILSGQIIGLVQKIGKEPEEQTPVTEES